MLQSSHEFFQRVSQEIALTFEIYKKNPFIKPKTSFHVWCLPLNPNVLLVMSFQAQLPFLNSLKTLNCPHMGEPQHLRHQSGASSTARLYFLFPLSLNLVFVILISK